MSNQLYSVAYINAIDPNENSISIDSKTQEISVHRHDDETVESWILNKCIYDNSSEGNYKNESQNMLWNDFLNWFQHQVICDKQSINCLCIGARDSGKSYALVGHNNVQDQGLIPRLVSYLFDPENNQNVISIEIGMCILNEDGIVDLLDPPTCHSYQTNLTYSETLGPIILCSKIQPCNSIDGAFKTLHFGVAAASVLALNSDNLYDAGNFMVSLQIYTKKSVYKVSLYELSHLALYSPDCVSRDRLSSYCMKYNTANILSIALREKDKSELYRELTANTKQPFYFGSVISFLLQDALVLGKEYLPTTGLHSNSTMVIACLRPTHACRNENTTALNFVQSLQEHMDDCSRLHRSFQNDETSPSAKGLSGGGQTNNNQTSDVSIIDCLNRECGVVTSLIEYIETFRDQLLFPDNASQTLVDMDHTTCASSTDHKRNKKKNERKLSELKVLAFTLTKKLNYLQEALQALKSPSSSVRENGCDVSLLAKWLAFRGMVEDTSQSSNPSLQPTLPWSCDSQAAHISRCEYPCLVPSGCCGFGGEYFRIAIPSGHMAVIKDSIPTLPVLFDASHDPLDPDSDRKVPNTASRQIAIKGVKNCKMFRLGGFGVESKHCIFFRVGSSIKVRPFYGEDGCFTKVEINDVQIEEDVLLFNGDMLRIGLHTVFYVHIPQEDSVVSNASDLTPAQMMQKKIKETAEAKRVQIRSVQNKEVLQFQWEKFIAVSMQSQLFEIISNAVSDVNHKTHIEVVRELIGITKKADMTDGMKMVSYSPSHDEICSISQNMSSTQRACICEALCVVHLVNAMSADMKKGVRFSVHLREVKVEKSHLHQIVYRGSNEICLKNKTFALYIHAEVMDEGAVAGRGESWWWTHDQFMQRYFIMLSMYSAYTNEFQCNLESFDEHFPVALDPFCDPSDVELIGVCYLTLDSLWYLLDIRENLTIITFQGHKGGNLKLTVRCWIDKVETVPTYISIDKESKLSDFMGRKCIIRFQFESLNGINPNLSDEVVAVYKFFCHPGQYRTTKHSVTNVEIGDENPHLNCTRVVEQVITPDFVEYIQKKSLEIELWGRRISNLKFNAPTESSQVLKTSLCVADKTLFLSLEEFEVGDTRLNIYISVS